MKTPTEAFKGKEGAGVRVRQPWELVPEELRRCAELLDTIVRPGDHDFFSAIQEAQDLFGYPVGMPRRRHTPRSFYGIHKPKAHT